MFPFIGRNANKDHPARRGPLPDHRRLVMAAVVVWLAHTVHGPAVSAEQADRPNIVVILADDVGIDAIGCYGGTSFKTPAIDKLAQSGTRFDHCYSMPVCHPTRICFLTGRYPRKLQNPKWGSFPRELETQTVAHTMQRLGYATAVAGKWQLSLLKQDPQQPHRMGFDKYCLFGWHEGARYHDPLLWQNGALRDGTAGSYGPDLYVDFLIDFFRQHQDQPFFAFYSMALCHDVTDDLKQPVPYVPGKQRYLNYGEMVQSMDQCVARIVDSLEAFGLRKKTWILFTGDNGTASRSIARAQRDPQAKRGWQYVREPVYVNFRGRRVQGGKGRLTDSGTHVPLIVSRPGSLAAGATSDALIDFSDFLPTFAALGGQADLPDALDGVSFANLLDGATQGKRSWAYSESKSKKYWVRDQRFKLYSNGAIYDLQTDPDETHDLQAQPPAAATQRLAALRRALQSLK